MAETRNDGGPAFPVVFPHGPADVTKGMSLRDYFAAAALQGFLADSSQRLIAKAIEKSPEGQMVADTVALARIVNGELAAGCYALADAMLIARAKAEDR